MANAFLFQSPFLVFWNRRSLFKRDRIHPNHLGSHETRPPCCSPLAFKPGHDMFQIPVMIGHKLACNLHQKRGERRGVDFKNVCPMSSSDILGNHIECYICKLGYWAVQVCRTTSLPSFSICTGSQSNIAFNTSILGQLPCVTVVSSYLLLLLPGVSVVCDGSVAGPGCAVLPASLPLTQPAHQWALSAPREGAPVGLHSLGWIPNSSESSGNTHHLCLKAIKKTTHPKWLKCFRRITLKLRSILFLNEVLFW